LRANGQLRLCPAVLTQCPWWQLLCGTLPYAVPCSHLLLCACCCCCCCCCCIEPQARVISSWYASSAGAQRLGFAKLWLFDNALGDAAAAALAPLIGKVVRCLRASGTLQLVATAFGSHFMHSLHCNPGQRQAILHESCLIHIPPQLVRTASR
jgi:hypothetical protein